jgi:hypothetical protein
MMISIISFIIIINIMGSKSILITTAALVSLSTVSCIRLALMNDIHLNLTYNSECSLPLCMD